MYACSNQVFKPLCPIKYFHVKIYMYYNLS